MIIFVNLKLLYLLRINNDDIFNKFKGYKVCRQCLRRRFGGVMDERVCRAAFYNTIKLSLYYTFNTLFDTYMEASMCLSMIDCQAALYISLQS